MSITHGPAEDCGVCGLQQGFESGADPLGVARLQTGYVALNKLQMYRGYTFFSATAQVIELFELEKSERSLHLYEMSEVAHAVARAFEPAKLNIETLGNTSAHLHWHIVPRHTDDPRPFAPIWENLEFLRATWTGVEEASDVREDVKARLVAELKNADVQIEQLF